jgi:hypothetical protein
MRPGASNRAPDGQRVDRQRDPDRPLAPRRADTTRRTRASFPGAWLGIACALQFLATAAPAADGERWFAAGQQGLVRLVIVPLAQASDRGAYERQIAVLCDPERTCFLNFYTNSTGMDPAVPLPDAISSEATATYRRSMKNGVEVFTWSCRLKVPGPCF